MTTFEQFYNNTLPQIITVINTQGQRIETLTLWVYILTAIIGLFMVAMVLRRWVKVERRK